VADVNYHVEAQPDGWWTIRREDREKPDAYYRFEEAAVSAARVLAHQNGGMVVVHEAGEVETTDYRGQPVT